MAGCIDRTIIQTIKHVATTGDLSCVSGHRFYLEDYTDPNIQVLVCKDCGEISVAWKYNEVDKKILKAIEREIKNGRKRFKEHT